MASFEYKRTFAVRFLAYFFILTGLSVVFFEFGPLLGAETVYRKNQVMGVKYTLPNQVITSAGRPVENSQSVTEGSFGAIESSGNVIKPVSTDYGIVIEKINANAKVFADIDPGNKSEYEAALAKGVAAALGSTKPGEKGNLFIFSHSADAAWNIIRFNAIFYLLRELEEGDRVSIFYQGRRYDYIVFSKDIVPPTDVSYLTNRYDQPVLTLQTCDPPGTLLNRLIIRAKLAGS